MKEASVSGADYRALAVFRYELRRFLAFSEDLARTAGLEPQQHQLLLVVQGLPAGQSATIGALAARMQLRHHSVGELVDRLVAQGLVARRRRPEDRRQVVVRLTAAGECRLKPLVRRTLQGIAETGPELIRALGTVIAHAHSRA